MTPGEAVTRLRTYLDEAQVGFYQDGDLYNALSDGIKEIVSVIYSLYKAKKKLNSYEPLPEVLKYFVLTTVNSFLYSAVYQLPQDFLFPVSVIYSVNGNDASNLKPAYQRESAEESDFLKGNTFLQSTSSAPFFTIEGGFIYFESPVTGTGACQVTYIRRPYSVSPYASAMDISEAAQNAVIQYAYSLILRKDMRSQESLAEYQTFLGMLQKLYM